MNKNNHNDNPQRNQAALHTGGDPSSFYYIALCWLKVKSTPFSGKAYTKIGVGFIE